MELGVPARCYSSADGSLVSYDGTLGNHLTPGTYLFDVSDGRRPAESVHIRWDAALVAVATFEDSDEPPSEVSIWDTSVAGGWVHQDPSDAYVPAATGATIANLTTTIGGTAAGGTVLDLSGLPSKRGRIKLVVTTTGYFHCFANSKGG